MSRVKALFGGILHSILGAGLLSALVLAAVIGFAGAIESPAAAQGIVSTVITQQALTPAIAVAGDITIDTTWTSGNVYEVSSDITVAANATLTVQPGVEVRFGALDRLTVQGKLVAVGTAGQPITFTGSTQSAGWWDGISIIGSSDTPNNKGSNLSYVTIEYGGNNNANLYLSYATITVTNSSFRNSAGDGIYGWYGGLAHISDSSFVGNQGYAVAFSDGTMNPALARLTATANGYNAVALGGGTMLGTHVWEATGIPYIVTADETVETGASLTIEPGTEVRFGQNAGLMSFGKLTATGTASQPITLTGQFTTPVAGWWDGVHVKGNSGTPNNTGSSFSYVTFEYGGGSDGNLMVTYATVTVTNSAFRYSGRDGIYGWYGGLAHVSDSVFTGNQQYAAQYYDGSMNPALARLTATGNGYNGIAMGGGIMQGAHTWESAGVLYYVIGDETVEEGATLTIEPGVEVRFGQGNGLTSFGKLTAVGTASQPITFTGQFTTPVAGWWDGISVKGSSSSPNNTGSTFNYATIEYGGNGQANLYVSYATVTVTSSILRNSGTDGMNGWYGGLMQVSDTSFTGNQGYALYYSDGSMNPVLARLTASGNGYNGVGLGGGTLRGAHTWENTGIPYLITGDETVQTGASLTVQPGVEVQFGQNIGLTSYGKLTAAGTATQPITFTGTTKQAGWWDGIMVKGNSSSPNQAGSTLDYVTVEYGGYNQANVYVSYSQISIAHSIVRNSSSHGIHAWYGGAGSVIESSQIVGNAGYGILNDDPDRLFLASNNWWGSATGPSTEAQGCNPSGAGSSVSSNVEFRPFLTAAGSDPGLLAPGDARVLSITPQRWFLPADGVVRDWITVTLRSGDGQPLPGRTVRLASSLGDVVDGGVTNAEGQALAYITSETPGQADLTATLDIENSCETARSASTTITFTTAQSTADLLPEEAAPYMNDDIEIDPEPITQGVATRLRAKLTNPNSFPISVNATFGIAQLGIGLAFGPVGSVENRVIPAGAESTIEVTWTPPISGHYCVRIDYSYRAADGVSALATNSGSAQRNLAVRRGSTGSSGEKGALNKAKNSIDAINKGKQVVDFVSSPAEFGAGFIGFAIPDFLFGEILDFNFDTWGKASEALGGDPPRQDYTVIATPERFTFTPLQASDSLPAARAAAANSLMEASLNLTALMRAAAISLDRYAGAAEADEQEWAARQVSALTYYKKQSGPVMVTVADRLDALLQELRSEGIQDIFITADAIRSYQERLRTQGFNAQELQAARSINMTDAEIETVRQERLAADPDLASGSLMSASAQVATDLRSLGNLLATQASPINVASAPERERASTNKLARIYSTDHSFVLGNPLAQTATISLTVRRVDMPPDWMVTVTPVTATLAAGAQTTIQVNVEPGSPTTQGTQPRLAVEGYAGADLVGGVVLDVLVPGAVPFDGKLRVYVPVTYRSLDSGW